MRRISTRRSLGVGSVLALALSCNVACGSGDKGSDEESNAAVKAAATNVAADRQDVLTAGADKEGELFVYTAMGLDDFNTFTEGFNELYPDIDITVFSGTGEKAVQRALTEYQAGRAQCRRHLRADDRHRLPGEGRIPAGLLVAQHPGGRRPEGTQRRARLRQPVRSGLEHRPGQRERGPRLVRGPAGPELEGTASGIEAGDVPWMATLFQEWGEDEGKAYFEDLGDQDPFVQDSHTTLAELVASGEVPISPTVYDYDAEGLKRDGAPIDWKPIDPLVAYPYVVSLPSFAPHPNASMLFIDYMLSKEGQQGIADLGRTPANPDVPPTLEGLKAMSDIPVVSVDPVTWSDGVSDFDEFWQQTIRN